MDKHAHNKNMLQLGRITTTSTNFLLLLALVDSDYDSLLSLDRVVIVVLSDVMM